MAQAYLKNPVKSCHTPIFVFFPPISFVDEFSVIYLGREMGPWCTSSTKTTRLYQDGSMFGEPMILKFNSIHGQQICLEYMGGHVWTSLCRMMHRPVVTFFCSTGKRLCSFEHLSLTQDYVTAQIVWKIEPFFFCGKRSLFKWWRWFRSRSMSQTQRQQLNQCFYLRVEL